MKENLDARLEKDFTNIEATLFNCKMSVNPNIAYKKNLLQFQFLANGHSPQQLYEPVLVVKFVPFSPIYE